MAVSARDPNVVYLGGSDTWAEQTACAAIDAQLARLRQIWETDLVRFNDLAKEKSVPAVILPPARLK